MIFGTEHDGGDYVDLVGGHGHPRADVRGIVMKGRMEDYRADLARRSADLGGAIDPGEADRVAAALATMPEAARWDVLQARRTDVGEARFTEEARALVAAAARLDSGRPGVNEAGPVVGGGVAAADVLGVPRQSSKPARADDATYAAVLARSGATHPDQRYGAGSGPRLSQ
jgi:hypothetical protein